MKKKEIKELAETYSSDRTFKSLVLEEVTAVFSRTKGKDGELDMSHIYQYYHPDIHFQDSVQETHGRTEFIFMMEKLLRRCARGFSMTVHRTAQSGNVIFMHWTMMMRFMGTPAMNLDGTSMLTLDKDGLIIDQRDHYDLWGDTIAAIPVINKLYWLFMKHVIG